jgi:RNA polymerase sigma factor (sigma-70 family)
MEHTMAVAPHWRHTDNRPRPTRDEERGIAERARLSDPRAIDRLVGAHLALVVHLAKEFRARGVPVEDLVSEGCIGLLKAMRRFDTSNGTRFTTYASFWVRKEMLRALVELPRVIHIPRYQRQKGEPAPREIRIDAELPGANGLRFADRLADPALRPASETLIVRQERESLRRHVLALPPRERTVIVHRYGLCGGPALTLEDVGRQLGVSRERVRQIEVSALKRLQRALRAPRISIGTRL